MIATEYLDKLGLILVQANVGEGGSAVVHKCQINTKAPGGTHFGNYRMIAVKEYKPEIVAADGQLNRVKQEAKIGSTLDSDYVVKVLHSDTGENPENPHCVLFMEWIEGPTLKEWIGKIHKDPHYEWDQLRNLCLNIIKGVEALHGNQIYHRDLKTENIMLRKGRPVVMDIGVAEIARGGENTLHTRVKDFLGSTRYASPQYVAGEEFTFADDVYSLGCIFLELFSGKEPYHHVERKVLISSSVLESPPPIGDLKSNSGNRLRVIIAGCTHKIRERRPTLSDLKEFFTTGDCDYIEIERQRQAQDKRGWEILSIENSYMYADIHRDLPSIGIDYNVIRLGNPVRVPSSGRMSVPEKLLGTASLIHIGPHSIAQFKFVPLTGLKALSESQLLTGALDFAETAGIGDRIIDPNAEAMANEK